MLGRWWSRARGFDFDPLIWNKANVAFWLLIQQLRHTEKPRFMSKSPGRHMILLVCLLPAFKHSEALTL